MQDTTKIPLHSAEIAGLWALYMNNTLAECVFTHFLEAARDPDVKPVVVSALELACDITAGVKSIYHQENMYIPMGFTSQDVFRNVPALYSDSFYLHYVKQMTRIGMTSYATIIPFATRADIRDMLMGFSAATTALDDQVTRVLLAKGVSVKSPNIPPPRNTEFAQDPGFIGSLMGEKRSLHAVEITHLFGNYLTNTLGKSLIIGFSQVAAAPEVRDYFLQGITIADKALKLFSKHLRDDDLPAPATWDAEVTDSRTAPFSDKLMMFHTLAINAAGFGYFAASAAASSRVDLAGLYGRLMAEVAGYSEDGAQIMIKNNWLEIPPKAADRKELALVR